MLHPVQNELCIAPWLRGSALFCIYPWVLRPTKTCWSGLPLDSFCLKSWRWKAVKPDRKVPRQKGQGIGLRHTQEAAFALNVDSPFGQVMTFHLFSCFLSLLSFYTLPNRTDLPTHVFMAHSSTLGAIQVSVVTVACSVCLLLGIVDALSPLKIIFSFSLFFKDCWVSGKQSGDGERLLLKFFFLSCFVIYFYSVWQRSSDVSVAAAALLAHALLRHRSHTGARVLANV